jgi:hypothetical protein
MTQTYRPGSADVCFWYTTRTEKFLHRINVRLILLEIKVMQTHLRLGHRVQKAGPASHVLFT